MITGQCWNLALGAFSMRHSLTWTTATLADTSSVVPPPPLCSLPVAFTGAAIILEHRRYVVIDGSHSMVVFCSTVPQMTLGAGGVEFVSHGRQVLGAGADQRQQTHLSEEELGRRAQLLERPLVVGYHAKTQDLLRCPYIFHGIPSSTHCNTLHDSDKLITIS